MWTIINIDDWAGLYDPAGVLISESHSFRLEDLQEVIPHARLDQITTKWMDGTALETYATENGCLPTSLNECEELANE